MAFASTCCGSTFRLEDPRITHGELPSNNPLGPISIARIVVFGDWYLDPLTHVNPM